MINNKIFSFISHLIKTKHIFILWVIFFCYAVCAALIFQKLLLPHLSSVQTGSGLITNDATYFESVAVSLAEKIKLHGWTSWQLYPANGAPGNVAVLAALYVIFGQDPSLAIPINAAIHAFSGLIIFLLARALSDKPSVGNLAGIVASTLFVIFPSALVWYGQNHKDGYAIAGMLLILLVWVKAINNPDDNKTWIWLIIGNFLAIILVGMVRPYGLKLLVIAALGVLLTTFVIANLKRRLGLEKKVIGYFIVVILMLIGGMKITVTLGGTQSDNTYANWQVETADKKREAHQDWQVETADKKREAHQDWQWRNATWLPDSIENYIEIAAKTRVGLIVYSLKVNAKSMIDADIAPENLSESIAYAPRALQVALFAPFPSTWVTNLSLSRLVASGEMFIYYLCVPGIFLLLFYNHKPTVWMTLWFACFFLLVYGFTQANLGTLYRYRHGYLFVILMMGVLGWVTWLHKTDYLRRLLHLIQPPAVLPFIKEALTADDRIKRKEVMGSGFLVMVLTLVCFIGFFLRDIMMAQRFGLGPALDSFFIALLIPMFIVTVFCMPLGAVFVPVYLNIKEQSKPPAARALLSVTSFWTTIALMIICTLLYLAGSTLLSLLHLKNLPVNMEQLIRLSNLALPLLLFSGVVILGNSVLNANGRAVLSSSAQLVVPISAILALLFFGNRFGIEAVMLGMVIGQLINLIVVQYYIGHYDASLVPQPELHHQIKFSPLLQQYFPLMASAFFVASATPVATLLAISLPVGSVSAFNLGSKVVLFVTGLVSTTVTAIMLPYFSILISKKNLISARRELSFFLLLATFVSVPISAGLYIWSEPIVRIIFERGSFDIGAVALVARVMQYAVIQLPFFVCNMLLLKFLIATKHVFALSVVTVLGLLLNVGAGVLLMPHMGVVGIALGTSVSVIFTTVLLILVLVRYKHISKFDLIILFLNGLMFITLLVSLHFKSFSSAFIIIFTYAILLIGYISTLRDNQFSTIK